MERGDSTGGYDGDSPPGPKPRPSPGHTPEPAGELSCALATCRQKGVPRAREVGLQHPAGPGGVPLGENAGSGDAPVRTSRGLCGPTRGRAWAAGCRLRGLSEHGAAGAARPRGYLCPRYRDHGRRESGFPPTAEESATQTGRAACPRPRGA